jgi:hypothetical protein
MEMKFVIPDDDILSVICFLSFTKERKNIIFRFIIKGEKIEMEK